MSLIYSIVGAMLAKVDCVTMGAGIPKQIPLLLDKISKGESVLTYNVDVNDFEHKNITQGFQCGRILRC